jgi:hypothetical protein
VPGVFLAAGAVPSFDMAGLSNLFADNAVSLLWKCLAAGTPKAFRTTFHSGLQEQRPKFGASCGKQRSTASICLLLSRQMTAFNPAPRHHLPELEAMSLLKRDWPRLSFEPGSTCLPADTGHAGNASYDVSLMIRAEHFFLFAPARAKMQDCAFIAVFAPILLLTLSIMPVLHAAKRQRRMIISWHHRPMTTHHLSISHNQFLRAGAMTRNA